jgi:hypothetical protein
MRTLVTCIALALVGVAQYWDHETLHGPFLLDDRGTVSQNPSVIEAAHPQSWERVWTCVHRSTSPDCPAWRSFIT